MSIAATPAMANDPQWVKRTKRRVHTTEAAQIGGLGATYAGLKKTQKGENRQFEGIQHNNFGESGLKAAKRMKVSGIRPEHYLPLAHQYGAEADKGARMVGEGIKTARAGRALTWGGVGVAAIGAPAALFATQAHANHKYQKEHPVPVSKNYSQFEQNTEIFKAFSFGGTLKAIRPFAERTAGKAAAVGVKGYGKGAAAFAAHPKAFTAGAAGLGGGLLTGGIMHEKNKNKVTFRS